MNKNTEYLEVFKSADFKRWLSKNHKEKSKIGLIIHKKHTGKKSPSHNELLLEAICYGWVDTVIKKLDEDRFIRFFSKRSLKGKWSYNTLSYGEKVIKEKRMKSSGLIAYKEGKKRLPLDHGIPKNPELPEEMKVELDKKKNKKAKEAWDKLAPSSRKTYLRWVIRGKQAETRKKRIYSIINGLTKDGVKMGISLKINI